MACNWRGRARKFCFISLYSSPTLVRRGADSTPRRSTAHRRARGVGHVRGRAELIEEQRELVKDEADEMDAVVCREVGVAPAVDKRERVVDAHDGRRAAADVRGARVDDRAQPLVEQHGRAPAAHPVGAARERARERHALARDEPPRAHGSAAAVQLRAAFSTARARPRGTRRRTASASSWARAAAARARPRRCLRRARARSPPSARTSTTRSAPCERHRPHHPQARADGRGRRRRQGRVSPTARRDEIGHEVDRAAQHGDEARAGYRALAPRQGVGAARVPTTGARIARHTARKRLRTVESPHMYSAYGGESSPPRREASAALSGRDVEALAEGAEAHAHRRRVAERAVEDGDRVKDRSRRRLRTGSFEQKTATESRAAARASPPRHGQVLSAPEAKKGLRSRALGHHRQDGDRRAERRRPLRAHLPASGAEALDEPRCRTCRLRPPRSSSRTAETQQAQLGARLDGSGRRAEGEGGRNPRTSS